MSVCVPVQIQIQIEIQIHIHIQIHHPGPRTADLGPRRCSSARCLVQPCSASSSVNKIMCVNVYLCLCASDCGPWTSALFFSPLSRSTLFSKFIGKQNHVCESVSVSVCACADSDVQIQTIDADH